MARLSGIFITVFTLIATSAGAPKLHTITFGKWITVKIGTDGDAPLQQKIRPLLVDGRIKEFVQGLPHEVTDQVFVVRLSFRLNDALPQEASPRWRWQLGGWLQVNRQTGRISPVSLPNFDAGDSAVNWYRDYAAYCGVSDDSKKVFAIVSQLGRHKPVLKEALRDVSPKDDGGPACPPPEWQRGPTRVNFAPPGGQPVTFAIRGSAAAIVPDDEAEEAQQ